MENCRRKKYIKRQPSHTLSHFSLGCAETDPHSASNYPGSGCRERARVHCTHATTGRRQSNHRPPLGLRGEEEEPSRDSHGRAEEERAGAEQRRSKAGRQGRRGNAAVPPLGGSAPQWPWFVSPPMKSSSFRLSALWLRTKVSPAGVNWTDTSDCSASAARSNSDRLGWSSFGDLRCGRAPLSGESVSRVGRSVEYGGMPVRGDTWCVSVGLVLLSSSLSSRLCGPALGHRVRQRRDEVRLARDLEKTLRWKEVPTNNEVHGVRETCPAARR